jgi:predicted lipoprotein with Yx(FWY)xxD motif
MVLIVFAGIWSGHVLTHHNSPAPDGKTKQQTSSRTDIPTVANTSASKSKRNIQSAKSVLVSGSSASIITIRSSTAFGNYLADGHAHTLYIYGRDKPDESHCSGACAEAWPPYTTDRIGSLPVNVSDIKRADGHIQYTYKGMPLYYFAGEAAGTIAGDGQNDFRIVKP